MEKRSTSRRNVLKKSSLLAVSSFASFGTTVTSAKDGGNKEFRKRFKNTDLDAIHDVYESQYGTSAADVVVENWRSFCKQVLNKEVSEQQALHNLIIKIAEENPEVLDDYETVSEEISKALTKSNLESKPVQETSNRGVSTMDDQQIYLNYARDGGSGVVGVRDSKYDVDKNRIQALTAVPGVGTVTQWVEIDGNVYIDNGGEHRIICDYYENGVVAGGSALYEIYISPEDDIRTYAELEEVGGPVEGREKRAVQLNLSGDTFYDIGVRLTCSTSGLAKAGTDYYTGNIPSGTRTLDINELRLESI